MSWPPLAATPRRSTERSPPTTTTPTPPKKHQALHVINRLAQELDIHAAVDAVRAAALDLLDCDRVTLYTLVESRRELVGRTGGGSSGGGGGGGGGGGNNPASSSSPGIDVPIRLRYGEGIAGYVAVSGETVNLRDAYEESVAAEEAAAAAEEQEEQHDGGNDAGTHSSPAAAGQQQPPLLAPRAAIHFNREVDRCTGYRTRSLLCCPIRDATGKTIAVLQALNKKKGGGGGVGSADGGVFTATDELLLRLVGVHLGNALAKSRLHAAAERERERLAALGRCFKRLSTEAGPGGGGAGAGGLRAVLDTVTAAARELVRAEQAVVFLADSARGELWTTVGVLGMGGGGSSGGASDVRTLRSKVGEGIVGACAAEKRQISLCVPLVVSGDAGAAAAAAAARPRAAAAAGDARSGGSSSNGGGSSSISQAAADADADARAAQRDPMLQQLLSALGWPPPLAAEAQQQTPPPQPAQQQQHAPPQSSAATSLPPPMCDLLLQPVLDPSTGACLAVLVALNACGADGARRYHHHHQRHNGRSPPPPPALLFEEDCFAEGDREAMAMLSREVADVLSAHALELSFASALSVVAARSGTNVAAPGLAARLRLQLLDFGDAGGPRVQAAAAGAAAAAKAGGLLMSPLLMARWSSLNVPLARAGSGSAAGSTSAGGKAASAAGAAAVATVAAVDGATTGASPPQHNPHHHHSQHPPPAPRAPFASGAAVAAAAATMRSRELSAIDLAFSGEQHDAARAVATAAAAGGEQGAAGKEALLEAAAEARAATRAPPRPPMDGSASLSSAGSEAWENHAAATAFRALAEAGGGSGGGGGGGGGAVLPSPLPPPAACSSLLGPADAGAESAAPPLAGGPKSCSLPRFASLQHALPALSETCDDDDGGSGEEGGNAAAAGTSPPQSFRPPAAFAARAAANGDAARPSTAPASSQQQQQQKQADEEAEPPAGATLLTPLTPSLALTSTRGALRDWALDCSSLPRERLVRLAASVFSLSAAARGYPLPEPVVGAFLSAVASHYRPSERVPYHNLGHVVQVLHTVWLLLETSPTCRAALKPVDELSLLVASLCHDLDHDGLSNAFHVNAQTDLALRYNDRSVMENHHCALTFAILRSGAGKGVFAGFSGEDARFARRAVCETILSTDMVQHYALTKELQEHGADFSAGTDADRLLLVRVLLHGADIGNPVRGFDVAARWSRRVHEEFSAQARLEREMGLPVTAAALDGGGLGGGEGGGGEGGDQAAAAAAAAEAEAARASMETHFIDYVVAPLWERLAQCFAPEMAPRLEALRANRDRFAAIAEGRRGPGSGGGGGGDAGSGDAT
jgi:GAF domain-containing protein